MKVFTSRTRKFFVEPISYSYSYIILLPGDRKDYTELGGSATALHPREGGQRSAHIPSSPPFKDVNRPSTALSTYLYLLNSLHILIAGSKQKTEDIIYFNV